MIMNKRAILFLIILFLISCSPRTVSVIKVIDGDTVIISNGEKVRCIGINAPETGEPFYIEAKRENKELVLGKKVKLEFDKEERDQYKRLLAYIYVGNIFVNYELLRKGLVFLYRDKDNKRYRDLLLEAEREARENRRGLWRNFHKYPVRIKRVNYNAKGKDEENLNGEYVVLRNTSRESVNLSNFRIKDESHNVFIFPEGSYIDGEEEVVVYTGKGLTGNNRFYWNHGTPVWNNDHDTVYLIDADGSIVDLYRY